jgi:hypothetical protein
MLEVKEAVFDIIIATTIWGLVNSSSKTKYFYINNDKLSIHDITFIIATGVSSYFIFKYK